MVGAEPGNPSRGPETAVPESAGLRDGLYGGLALVFTLATLRGVTGASTTTGRIVVAVIFGGLALACAVGGVIRRRRAQWLLISDDSIELFDPKVASPQRLSRSTGRDVHFVMMGTGRVRSRGLTIPGSGTVLPLAFFAKKRVAQVCVAHGWTVG